MPNPGQIPPFSFQLDIEQCSTDISELDILFDGGPPSLAYDILNMHISYGDNTSLKHKFYSFLKSLDTMLNKLEPNGAASTETSKLEVNFNGNTYYVGGPWPLGVLMADKKDVSETESNVMPNKINVAVIQFSEYTLVPGSWCEDPGDLVIDPEPLMSDFQQLVGLMLLAETPGGAVTDGILSIFLEFNLDAIKQQLDSGTFNKRVIPMKLYAAHAKGMFPSAFDSWGSWYIKCCRGVAERKIMKGLKFLYLSVDETS